MSLACIPFVDPSLDGNYKGSVDESELSGTVRLSRPVGDHLVYGGYARGYKAGGFNMDRSGLISPILTLLTTGTANVPGVHEWMFHPETVDAFEVGAKFEFENRRATMDVNLFHEKFEGFQLTAYTGLAFEALNIPEVTSKGIEVEARGVIIGGVEMFGGITYADVRYGEGPEYGVRSGQQMTHAPRWTGVAGATCAFWSARLKARSIWMPATPANTIRVPTWMSRSSRAPSPLSTPGLCCPVPERPAGPLIYGRAISLTRNTPLRRSMLRCRVRAQVRVRRSRSTHFSAIRANTA